MEINKNHIFLILNYNSYDYTVNLIQSILKCSYVCNIVVVDNGSHNESYEILYNKYIDEKNIYIIKTNENLGFAKGNNFGYDYIKNTFENVDYIHCTNSDILMYENEFLTKVEEYYLQDKFFLAGPNVLTEERESSPMGIINSEKDFEKYISKLKILTLIYNTNLKIFGKYYDKIFGNKLEEVYQNYSAKKIHKKLLKETNITPLLSGCYMIFSKKYIEEYDSLFIPITFLYCEEALLTHRLIHDKNDIVKYYGDISVIHDHAGSSKGNQKQKVKLVLENIAIMKSYMKDLNKN